ncbi:Alpha/Beta hydrolase protein [Clohesyomyces aquaticus]|uniref:Alpha/Beta hydrolase protein n=1 Tax=Clohesyomyces aquaticus TaxID=1231657 RepID=A0A1Y1Z463_9PLEO|nr:Alpha/Beta hydrolase protein [Clohesyomyces aquaticus]
MARWRSGTAAYPDWFTGFWVPFLHRNSAITILPNYRLTPEHTGDDILADIADFWVWFRDTLPTYLASKNPSLSIDFDKVLVSGESAGGWCALQSILTLPKDTFNACLIQYPVTNAFPVALDDKLMGYPVPPKEELDKFLAEIVPGTILSSVMPPARSFVSTMLRAHGRWDEFFGNAKHLMPDTRLEDAQFWVTTYIIHGENDTVVRVKWTRAFVEKIRARFPETKVELVTPEGDHGFDEAIYEDDEEWLAELLKGVEGDWLA